MPTLELTAMELQELAMGARILVNQALADAKRMKGTSMALTFLKAAEQHQAMVEKLERLAKEAEKPTASDQRKER